MAIPMNNQRIDTFFARTGRPEAGGGEIDRLLQWANYLSKEERVLLELIVRAQLTRQKVAELLGVPKGTVTRRLHRIARRLYNPLSIALMDERCTLPEDQREIAIAYLIRREPMSHLARRLGRPVTAVRDTLSYVRGWHRGMVIGSRASRQHANV